MLPRTSTDSARRGCPRGWRRCRPPLRRPHRRRHRRDTGPRTSRATNAAPPGTNWLEFSFRRRATSRAGSKEGRLAPARPPPLPAASPRASPDRNVLMYLRTTGAPARSADRVGWSGSAGPERPKHPGRGLTSSAAPLALRVNLPQTIPYTQGDGTPCPLAISSARQRNWATPLGLSSLPFIGHRRPLFVETLTPDGHPPASPRVGR